MNDTLNEWQRLAGLIARVERRLFASVVLLALALLAFALSCASAPVTLAWDPSPDPGVAFYRLHYGTNSGQYDFWTNAGPATRITVEVSTNATWWFAVSAVGSNQLESELSNEVGWPAPAPPILQADRYVMLTPVIRRQINGGPWFQTNLWPTYLEATNSIELFQGIRIDRRDFAP